MKNTLICGAALLCPLAHAVTVTFEDLSPTRAYAGPGGGAFENGLNDDPDFQSGPLTFETGYSPDFGGFWTGWAYSNTTDATTAGFGNQYSAYPGIGGNGSSTYVMGNRFGGSIGLDIPANFNLISLQLAISTYSAKYILGGDNTFGNEGRAFGGNPDIIDLLQVRISGTLAGLEVASPIDVNLADSGDPDDFGITNEWIDVDLTSLAAADNLRFTIVNTQGGVASYFALDNIELVTVPEPSTVLLCLGALGFLARRPVRK